MFEKITNQRGVRLLLAIFGTFLLFFASGFSSINFYVQDTNEEMYVSCDDVIVRSFFSLVEQAPIEFKISRRDEINILTMARFVTKVSPVVTDMGDKRDFLLALYLFTGELIGEMERRMISPRKPYFSFELLKNRIKNFGEKQKNYVSSELIAKSFVDGNPHESSSTGEIEIKVIEKKEKECSSVNEKVVSKEDKKNNGGVVIGKKSELKAKRDKVDICVFRKKVDDGSKNQKKGVKIEKKSKKLVEDSVAVLQKSHDEVMKKSVVVKKAVDLKKRTSKVTDIHRTKNRKFVELKKDEKRVDEEMARFMSIVNFEKRGDEIIESLSVDYGFLLE